MATKHKVTVSVQAINHRPSSAERRAAQAATLESKQAQLKQEAADRRAHPAKAKVRAPSVPRRAVDVGRLTAF